MEGMGTRPGRVGEEFREILAEEIQRLKDPRIGFVTVTRVEVTPDLKTARVYYTALGDDAARQGSRAGLESARRHLRAALGRKVRLKFTPELRFVEDGALERGAQVVDLIERVHREHGEHVEQGDHGDHGEDGAS